MLNLRLAHRSEWLEAKLGILAGLAEALQNRAPIETLVDDLLMRCIDAAGGSRGAAYLLDTTGTLVLHAHLGYELDAADALASCFGATDLALAALERGTPIAISAQSSVDDAPDLLDRAQVKTLTIAPMSLGDEQLGVLLLGESLDVATLVGGAITVAGVFLLNRPAAGRVTAKPPRASASCG